METSIRKTNGHAPWTAPSVAETIPQRGRLHLVRAEEPLDVSDRILMDMNAAALRLRSAARKLGPLESESETGAFGASVGALERARRILREAIDGMPDAPERRIIRVGALEIVPAAYAARYNRRTLELSRKEFELLCHLGRDPRAVCAKSELLRDVWGYQSEPSTRTVDSHASRLRRKIIEAGAPLNTFVINYWGIGYSLIHPER